MHEQPDRLLAALGVFEGFPDMAAPGAVLGLPAKSLELIRKARRANINPCISEDVLDPGAMPLELPEGSPSIARRERAEGIPQIRVLAHGP